MNGSSALKQAFILSLGGAVALGFARFAYALLLPAMKDDLHWTYAQAGVMNTLNALGYLIGALSCYGLMQRFGAARVFLAGIVLSSVALIMSGTTSSFVLLGIWRLLAGISGAMSFVGGGLLVAHVANQQGQYASRLLGVYYGGSGFGMLFSALFIPFALQLAGEYWRYCWMLLGVAALGVFALSYRDVLRISTHSAQTQHSQRNWTVLSPLFFSILAYLMFALGYIAYMTFAIALLKNSGWGAGFVAVFWAVLALAVIGSPMVWSGIMGRWQGARAMSLIMLSLALGSVLLLSGNMLGLLVSAVLFGGSFLAVVTTTTAMTRSYLPQNLWSLGISVYTVIFAAGQSLGPYLFGYLADSKGLGVMLQVSSGILLLGSVLALLQKPRGLEAVVQE